MSSITDKPVKPVKDDLLKVEKYNKMKSIITILCILIIGASCPAQQLKTYSGEYDLKSYEVDILGVNEGWLDGTANYTYYEDKEYRRILSGNFSYNGKLNSNMVSAAKGSVSLYVKGNYKSNKKNGKWYIKQSIKMNDGNSSSCIFNGNYKNGIPNGSFSVTIAVNGNSFTCSANFTNNVLTDDFKISSSSNKGQITNGKIGDNGYLTGKVEVIKNNIETKAEYQRGLCTFILQRNLQDGKIYENYFIDPDELKIFNLLMDEKDTTITDTVSYKLTEGYASFIGDDFIEMFKSGSLMDMFPGDVSLDENGRFSWRGFQTRILQKSESRKEFRIRLEKERLEKERLEKERLEVNNQNVAIYNDFKTWNDNHLQIKNLCTLSFFGTKAKVYNIYKKKNDGFDNELTKYIEEARGYVEDKYVRIPYYSAYSTQQKFNSMNYLFDDIKELKNVRRLTNNGNNFSTEILKIINQSDNTLKALGKELNSAKSEEDKLIILGLDALEQ